MSTNLDPNEANEEFALGQLVGEAGDPRVERSSAQIVAVEQAILTALQRQSPVQRRHPLPRWSTATARAARRAVMLAAGVALAVWLGRNWNGSQASHAWAQVAQTINGKPWVHSVWRGPEGPVQEVWLSPAERIAAQRTGDRLVSLSDFREGVLREYRAEEKVITLRPIGQMESEEFRLLAEIFELITGRHDPTGLKRAEIVEETRREVKEGNKLWTEFDFVLRLKRGTQRLVFRVDPATHLPESLSAFGMTQSGATPPDQEAPARRFVLDYPATGPTDIYALGVPKDTKIVDCGGSADLQQLTKRIDTGRARFDHYIAVVVRSSTHDGVTQRWWQAWNFYRVYRKGNRWRVEECFRIPRFQDAEHLNAGAPAADVDHKEWWMAEANRRVLVPVELCDGKTVYRYSVDFGKPADNGEGDTNLGEPVLFDARPFTEVQDYHWDRLKPDLVGRPSLSGLIGSPHYSVGLDLNPTTGPPGTVLLEIAALKGSSMIHGPHPDTGIRRYWLDPSRNYLATRWEESKKQEGRETLTSASQIVKTAVTPQGQVYPVEVRVENVAGPDSQTEHFYVDFETEIPDSLFEPPTDAAK